MRLLLCIFLPFLGFFMIGRPLAAIMCLILQMTLIGWLPAALWAIFALGQWKIHQKIQRALKASQASAANAARAAAPLPTVTQRGTLNEPDPH